MYKPFSNAQFYIVYAKIWIIYFFTYIYYIFIFQVFADVSITEKISNIKLPTIPNNRYSLLYID